jgi:hypothetical protein
VTALLCLRIHTARYCKLLHGDDNGRGKGPGGIIVVVEEEEVIVVVDVAPPTAVIPND